MAKNKEYLIRWEITISAKNPLEACREAKKIQKDPESTANVFSVFLTHPEIDLDEIDSETLR